MLSQREIQVQHLFISSEENPKIFKYRTDLSNIQSDSFPDHAFGIECIFQFFVVFFLVYFPEDISPTVIFPTRQYPDKLKRRCYFPQPHPPDICFLFFYSSNVCIFDVVLMSFEFLRNSLLSVYSISLLFQRLNNESTKDQILVQFFPVNYPTNVPTFHCYCDYGIHLLI